jgi:hypothetical protein
MKIIEHNLDFMGSVVHIIPYTELCFMSSSRIIYVRVVQILHKHNKIDWTGSQSS